MKTFRLTITSFDNDAVVDDPHGAVADILKDLGRRIAGACENQTQGKVFDANGNAIGHWEFEQQ